MAPKRVGWGIGIGAATIGLVALIAPQSTWAYYQGVVGARLATKPVAGTDGPIGCFQQETVLQHGGSSSPMSITSTTRPHGFGALPAPQTGCNPVSGAGIYKYIRGSTRIALLKLISVGSGTNPDNYSVCRTHTTTVSPWVTTLTASQNWSTPPCGGGQYVDVVCLTNAEMFITDFVVALGGGFTAANTTQCNHSPWWHKAEGNGTGSGTVVKLKNALPF
jgi:hypothetical protein